MFSVMWRVTDCSDLYCSLLPYHWLMVDGTLQHLSIDQRSHVHQGVKGELLLSFYSGHVCVIAEVLYSSYIFCLYFGTDYCNIVDVIWLTFFVDCELQNVDISICKADCSLVVITRPQYWTHLIPDTCRSQWSSTLLVSQSSSSMVWFSAEYQAMQEQ